MKKYYSNKNKGAENIIFDNGLVAFPEAPYILKSGK